MVSVGRWIVEAIKDTHQPESYRYVNKSCNQGETEILLSFNWSSSIMKTMRNN